MLFANSTTPTRLHVWTILLGCISLSGILLCAFIIPSAWQPLCFAFFALVTAFSLLFAGRKLCQLHHDLEQIAQRSAALRLQEQKLYSIFEGSSDALMLLTPEGFFDCNTCTLEMFETDCVETFTKLHPSDLSPELQPCGTPSAELARRFIQEAYDTGGVTFEWVHKSTADREFPAEVCLTSFKYGDVDAVLASVRDISARNEAEAHLKMLNEQLKSDIAARVQTEASLRETTAYLDVYRKIMDSHAIVAETDLQGNITRVNDAFCKISGYSREELIGKNHRILNSGVHPKSMWSEMYHNTLLLGVWHGEVCNRNKHGELYWVDTTIAPLWDESGRVRGFFSIRTDITGLKNAQSEAVSASLAKSEFLANMSHEIRTPMTAILGYADLIAESEERPGGETQRMEFVETIKRNGEHLLAIINDILDLSKIEANKLQIEHLPVRPEGIVQEVTQLMEVKAKGAGLKLNTMFASDVPHQIVSDPTRLRQILVNLIGNAIKFTEQGAVEVNVTRATGDSPKLRFEVRDSGIGMTDEQCESLFEAFSQADASTTRKFGGTGLGLRISRRLAQMLGGDIEVESEIGRGSRFTLTVDAKETEAAASLGETLARADLFDNAAKVKEPLAGKRILLAEDGPDNQRLISFHLRKAGAEVTIAENGLLAVQLLCQDGDQRKPLLNTQPFDLVVTDIQMPVMDGHEATRLLRSKGFNRPILALTAHAMKTDEAKCFAAGCKRAA